MVSQELILLVYGVPSLLLTLFLLILLSKNKFKYSFYRVLQCDLTVNILAYLGAWQHRFCFWDVTAPMMLVVFENFHVLFSICGFCINFLYNVQATNVILMSIHRLSSAVFIKTNEFWTRFFLPSYVVIIMGYLAWGSYIYSNEMVRGPHYDYNATAFATSWIESTRFILFNQIFFYTTLSYFSIIMFINILTIFCTRSLIFVDSAKTQRMMRSLTLIAVLNSTIYLLVFVWQYLGPQLDYGAAFYTMMYLVQDAQCLAPSFALLAFDRNVHHVLGEIFACCTRKDNRNKLPSSTSVVSII